MMMPSKIRRRSGLGFVAFAEAMGWRPDVVFQVGVGFNFQELDVMRESWPGCEFVGFEPHPDIYRGIAAAYPGTLYQIAITDFFGKAILHDKHRHAEGSSLHEHDEKKGKQIWVRACKLDRFFLDPLHYDGKQILPPHYDGKQILFWLDCEGSELNALRGGLGFLKHVQVVNVELTGKPPGKDWCKPGDVHRLLNEQGFLRQWHHTNRSCVAQIDAVYVRRELFKPELCCCPCQVEMYHADV